MSQWIAQTMFLKLCGSIINPRRMREGYCSRCVYVSVTELTATYLTN